MESKRVGNKELILLRSPPFFRSFLGGNIKGEKLWGGDLYPIKIVPKRSLWGQGGLKEKPFFGGVLYILPQG